MTDDARDAGRARKGGGGFLRANWPKILTGGGGLGAMAGVTGYVSYGHIEAVTLALGQAAKYARVWPFGVDGMVVVGSVVLLTAKRERWAGWLCIGLGITQSVAANIADGWSGVSTRDGWLIHAAAAGWAGFLALSFAAACFAFERWIADLIADWKKSREDDGDAAQDMQAVPAALVPPVLTVLPAAPAPPVVLVRPVVPAPPVVPVAPVAPAQPVLPVVPVAPAPPVAPEVPVGPPVPVAPEGDAPDCCPAHGALRTETVLGRDQQTAVVAAHREAHRRDIGAEPFAKIFGMGSHPARTRLGEIRAELGPVGKKAAPAPAGPAGTTSDERGPAGAGPAEPGQPGEGEPDPAGTPDRPGPAEPGPAGEPGRPAGPEDGTEPGDLAGAADRAEPGGTAGAGSAAGPDWFGGQADPASPAGLVETGARA